MGLPSATHHRAHRLKRRTHLAGEEFSKDWQKRAKIGGESSRQITSIKKTIRGLQWEKSGADDERATVECQTRWRSERQRKRHGWLFFWRGTSLALRPRSGQWLSGLEQWSASQRGSPRVGRWAWPTGVDWLGRWDKHGSQPALGPTGGPANQPASQRPSKKCTKDPRQLTKRPTSSALRVSCSSPVLWVLRLADTAIEQTRTDARFHGWKSWKFPSHWPLYPVTW